MKKLKASSYQLNLPAAHKVMENMAKRYAANHYDKEARKYFNSDEFRRWFEVDKAILLKFVRQCPRDKLDYALTRIRPRSEESQKALTSKN